MALKWFSTRQEGAVLPMGRAKPEFYFRFLDRGSGGVGAFLRKMPDGSLQTYQVGVVAVGDGRVRQRALLSNSQSGLPLRFDETTGLDFLSIGKTPQLAQAFPTLVRTDGVHVTRQAALAAVFGTVAHTRGRSGAGGYLMATAAATKAADGTDIPAGINYLSVVNLGRAPAAGYFSEELGEFAPLENRFTYPEGSQLVPLFGVVVKDTYYLVERDDSSTPPSYRLSSFVISKGTYRAGPILPVTPLGLAYSEAEGSASLVLLGFRTAGTTDNLYRLDPVTGEVSQLTVVGVNDPLEPFKRQGVYFLGRDPSSSLDQFSVLETSYLNLAPDVEQTANGDWFVRRALPNPTNYAAITTQLEITSRDGQAVPDEPLLPVLPPGDPPPNGFPRSVFPAPPKGTRDLPVAVTKWVPFYGPFTAETFHTWAHIIFGRNGRIRGMRAIPNASNTQVAIEVGDDGGALFINGIVCFFPSTHVISPVPIVGGPPYALTAFTANALAGSPITFAVESYNPAALTSKAILAVTDSSGFEWAPTPALGQGEISDAANTKQFTPEEERLLVARDGPIDVADSLHRHRIPIPKEVFEAIFGHDYDKVPHPPKGTPPALADRYHTHEGILNDFELEALTPRGGITSADSMHTHDTLPSPEEFAAVFGGPNADASALHTHLDMLQAHGLVANPRAAKKYVPQNVGTGQGRLNAAASVFTGSLSLILGESVVGSGVNRIIGIRYKEFALFMHSTLTAAIGGGTPGLPLVEQTELFGPDNPSGILDLVQFNEIFTWRGIEMQVVVPEAGGTPFVLGTPTRPKGDFFTFHGIQAATLDKVGSPAVETPMEEGLMCRAAPRYVIVLDERYPGGAFLAMGMV